MQDDCFLSTALSWQNFNSLKQNSGFRSHTILTDNGAQFAWRCLAKALRPAGEHPFGFACRELEIRRRLNQFRHPWTSGQSGRFNRTLREETVKKFYYANQARLAAHLKLFLRACNQARRLRAINHLTPQEKLLELCQKDARLFIRKPGYLSLGPNTASVHASDYHH